MKTTSKMKMASKLSLHPQFFLFAYFKEYYLKLFDDLSPQRPEILSGVQNINGIQHDDNSICGVVHVRTCRKGNIVMQR